MAKLGKRLKAAYEKINSEKHYGLTEAIPLVKEFTSKNFDETVELAINLGIDTRHSDQQVRGVMSLPNGTGKTVRVAVFAKDGKAEEARKAGADVVGDDDLVEKVKKGEIEFDRCIATPDMMAKVGTLGKVLGPRGLMPNPKLGTVTLEIGEAVKSAKGGQIEFKADKGGVVQVGLGKASFGQKELEQNILAFVKAITAAKPNGAKGTYIKSVHLSSTMGAGIQLEILPLLPKAA